MASVKALHGVGVGKQDLLLNDGEPGGRGAEDTLPVERRVVLALVDPPLGRGQAVLGQALGGHHFGS